MIAIVAGACLGSTAAEEGRDLKSLVSPQTLSCELQDIRLTRTNKISTDRNTEFRGTGSTTTSVTATEIQEMVDESSSNYVENSRNVFDTRLGGKFNAEGGAKWGLKPAYGSIGGGVSFEGAVTRHGATDLTNSSGSNTKKSSRYTGKKSSYSEQAQEIKDSDMFHLGEYVLKFSVVLENRNAQTNDELIVDCSQMKPVLRGPGLTGEIHSSCSERDSRTLDVGTNSFEFVYQINDKKMFDELIRLGESGQLNQLSMSKTGAVIPVSKKSGTKVLSAQSVTEQRNPGTTVLVELGRFRRLPFWRVSRQHTARSGHQGDFVTLREAF